MDRWSRDRYPLTLVTCRRDRRLFYGHLARDRISIVTCTCDWLYWLIVTNVVKVFNYWGGNGLLLAIIRSRWEYFWSSVHCKYFLCVRFSRMTTQQASGSRDDGYAKMERLRQAISQVCSVHSYRTNNVSCCRLSWNAMLQRRPGSYIESIPDLFLFDPITFRQTQIDEYSTLKERLATLDHKLSHDIMVGLFTILAYEISFRWNCIVRIFERFLTGNRSNTPQLNVARC